MQKCIMNKICTMVEQPKEKGQNSKQEFRHILKCKYNINLNLTAKEYKHFLIRLMLINRLEMSNFKSYSGSHVLGPFDDHFNCVIGPNGNGKSNIIDAVLFVFGFKSSKLRQDSMTSLIHKSAFSKPDTATVSVIFKFKEQGKKDIKISRTIKESGHSYYRLNEVKISWAELRELLINEKIDLNKNLFIILQGEVQRLCELSPEKLVEYFQYVSGSDEFKENIENLENQYVDISLAADQIHISSNLKKKIFESVQNNVDNLAQQIALKFKISLFNHLILKKQVEEKRCQIKKLKQEQMKQNEQKQKIDEQINMKSKQLRENQRIVMEHEKKIKATNQIIAETEQQKNQLSIKIKQIHREKSFLTKDRDNFLTSIGNYNNQKKQIDKINNQCDQIMKEHQQIKQNISSIQNLNKFKVYFELEEKMTKESTKYQQLKQKFQQLNSRFILSKQNEGKNKIKMMQYRQKKIMMKTQINKINETEIKLQAKLKDTQESIQTVKFKIKQQTMEKSMTNQDKVIHQIKIANKMQLICSNTTITTLREYVIIDPIYEDVIQTILPQLDFIIVENTDQAKEISDYLKKKKIGRITFLIKDLIFKVVTDAMLKQNFTPPSQTQRIFDLCKCTNQEIRKILYWILGNMLYTEKIEIAMKVAFYDSKMYKVITKNGEYIDNAGTMTKLMLKKNSGTTKEEQQIYQKKLEILKKTFEEMSFQIENNKQEKSQLIEQIKKIQLEENRLEQFIDYNTEEDQIQQITKKVEEKQSIINQIEKNIHKIKNTIQNNDNDEEFVRVYKMVKLFQESNQKIKRIEASNSIKKCLQEKITQIRSKLNDLERKIQANLKQNEQIQKIRLKITIKIQKQQEKNLKIEQQKIRLQEQSSSIKAQIDKLNQLLGKDNAINKNKNKIRQSLTIIRAKLRNQQCEQISHKEKLIKSLKQIKQFSRVIWKKIIKQNSDFTHIFFDCDQEKLKSNQIEVSEQQLLSTKIIKCGANNYSFSQMLFSSQKLFLKITNQNSFNMSSLYQFETQQNQNLFFDSVSTKILNICCAVQKQKLGHFNNQERGGWMNTDDLELNVFDDYKEKKQDFEQVFNKLTKIKHQQKQIKEKLIFFRNKRTEIFTNCFSEINIQLGHIYHSLTGGKAEISLVDALNPFEGIEFSVRPVNKSWKNVHLLSGGQKTFTSLALIFACEQIKKFPFYFMDEIDAALDYRNTSLLASYVKSKTNTQHIVISLRKNMYQQCKRIIGVYKVKDMSQTLETTMEEILK